MSRAGRECEGGGRGDRGDGGVTVNVADSMREFATGVVEVVADASPTATTSPLLKAVTPVRPSWLLPGSRR